MTPYNFIFFLIYFSIHFFYTYQFPYYKSVKRLKYWAKVNAVGKLCREIASFYHQTSFNLTSKLGAETWKDLERKEERTNLWVDNLFFLQTCGAFLNMHNAQASQIRVAESTLAVVGKLWKRVRVQHRHKN